MSSDTLWYNVFLRGMRLMKLKIHNQTMHETKKMSQLLKRIFRKIKNTHNMHLIFIDQQQMQKLNLTYRKIDKTTDVLSFSNDDLNEKSLGDVFISIDQAILQAESYGHSLDREIGFLAVHGYLHLIGYDHHTQEEEKKMQEMQEHILKKAKLERI
jgi:probable rRNA maturation factor